MCELTKDTSNSTQTGRKGVSSVSMNCWHGLSFRSGGDCWLCLIQSAGHYLLFKFINPTDYVVFETERLETRS